MKSTRPAVAISAPRSCRARASQTPSQSPEQNRAVLARVWEGLATARVGYKIVLIDTRASRLAEVHL